MIYQIFRIHIKFHIVSHRGPSAVEPQEKILNHEGMKDTKKRGRNIAIPICFGTGKAEDSEVAENFDTDFH